MMYIYTVAVRCGGGGAVVVVVRSDVRSREVDLEPLFRRVLMS